MSTLTIQPSSKDNFMSKYFYTDDYRHRNYGGTVDNGMCVNNYGGRTDGQDNLCRALLEFSLSSYPAGATLNTATLSLYYLAGSPINPSGKTIWAYKLTRTNWAEGSGIAWTGNTNDSSWNRYSGSQASPNNWTTGGGDYVTSSPSGGSTTFPASAGAWMSWTVTAIVQDALDGSNPAEFLVKMADESIQYYTSSSYAYFNSKEYTSDTSLRPKLVLDYTGTTFIPSVRII